MSTAAAKNFPAVSGTAARALTGLKPAGGSERKLRTPLSVVRSTPRKRRAPFVVLCFALLAVALMAVLVLNISVSTAQYQLVQLRSDQSTLTKQNQDLTQQVQNFDAPQNLAAKAAELGMVASTGKGQIDLSTLTVSGTPKPAAKGDKPGRRHCSARCRRTAHCGSARHHQGSAGRPQTGGSRGRQTARTRGTGGSSPGRRCAKARG